MTDRLSATRVEGRTAPRRPRHVGRPMLTVADLTLMESLGLHRVLTTAQAARAAALPQRTANYRLNRLRESRLVDRLRPYAASGSTPLHWWLTTAGRQRLGLPGRVRASWTSPLFLAHTAATAAVPLALGLLGPQVGLQLLAWARDEDAWESWPTPEGTRRITPDGYALVRLEDSTVPMLVEVDRATMPLGRLREKAYRYLRYTAAEAWRGRHVMCPVLLLLTTSDDRARNALAAAAGERARILGPTGQLLVAVSGSVDNADAAVIEPVWRLDDGGDAQLGNTDAQTLTELLSYRISTEQCRRSTERAERGRAEARELGRRLADASPPAWHHDDCDADGRTRQVLSALLDRDDSHVASWAVDNLELARALADSLSEGPAALHAATASAVVALHPALLTEQLRLARAAVTAAAVGDPRLRRAAESLTHGYLVPGRLLDDVTAAPRSFDRCQAALLAGYAERRDMAVDAIMAERRRRRVPGRGRLLAEHDIAHLRTCLCCGLHHAEPEAAVSCRGCGSTLGTYDATRPARSLALLQAFLDSGETFETGR